MAERRTWIVSIRKPPVMDSVVGVGFMPARDLQ